MQGGSKALVARASAGHTVLVPRGGPSAPAPSASFLKAPFKDDAAEVTGQSSSSSSEPRAWTLVFHYFTPWGS